MIIKSIPHDVSSMVAEFDNAHARFNVPEHAGHVARTSYDLPVANKPAATQIAGVSAEFASTSGTVGISAIQVVYRTDVVKTTTSDEVSGWRISACHDPAGP